MPCVVLMFCGFGRSKSRLAKAAGAGPSGEMRDEQLHTVAARKTFRSENAKSTSCSGRVWSLTHSRSVRRCAAKHVRKTMAKAPHARSTFGREKVEKAHSSVAHNI